MILACGGAQPVESSAVDACVEARLDAADRWERVSRELSAEASRAPTTRLEAARAELADHLHTLEQGETSPSPERAMALSQLMMEAIDRAEGLSPDQASELEYAAEAVLAAREREPAVEAARAALAALERTSGGTEPAWAPLARLANLARSIARGHRSSDESAGARALAFDAPEESAPSLAAAREASREADARCGVTPSLALPPPRGRVSRDPGPARPDSNTRRLIVYH